MNVSQINNGCQLLSHKRKTIILFLISCCLLSLSQRKSISGPLITYIFTLNLAHKYVDILRIFPCIALFLGRPIIFLYKKNNFSRFQVNAKEQEFFIHFFTKQDFVKSHFFPESSSTFRGFMWKWWEKRSNSFDEVISTRSQLFWSKGKEQLVGCLVEVVEAIQRRNGVGNFVILFSFVLYLNLRL